MSAILGQGWTPPLLAAAAAVLVAVLGAVATVTDAWYRSLRVPAWKPPDWAFGPAWTVIFTLTATAGVLAWNAEPELRETLLAAYAVNGVLNVAWSVIFFRMRRPDLALMEVALLWVSIAVLVLVTGRASLTAGVMNLPYLAWVSVAACLNLRIVQLNPAFQEA